jgi:hypothetical protein
MCSGVVTELPPPKAYCCFAQYIFNGCFIPSFRDELTSCFAPFSTRRNPITAAAAAGCGSGLAPFLEPTFWFGFFGLTGN